MANRFSRYLTDLLPRVGRLIKENGEAYLEADAGFLEDLSDPLRSVFRKRGYSLSSTRTDVANGNIYYYSIAAPADKHVVVFDRVLGAGEGPVSLDTIIGATFTPGTPLTPQNLFLGGPAAGTVVTSGATGVTGGTTVPSDWLFSAGNKQATAAAAGLAGILPPSTSVLFKITNTSGGTNPGIRLALQFAELDIPSDLI